MKTLFRVRRAPGAALSLAIASALTSSAAFGHGFVGDRFFPPTIATDDPFAVDELALPTISYFTNPASDGSPANHETDVGFEFDKEIFPHFAIGISDDHVSQHGYGGPSAYGWDNIELSAKYELFHIDPHEFIFSLGVVGDIGDSGSKATDDTFSTITPTAYFGKGFGDLPDKLAPLQPLAVTGTLGEAFPTRAAAADQFQWGLAVEYSLPYLQEHVKDIGLPAPVRDFIPLVEFNMATDENRASGGRTTGTINPGVLWETPYCQLGVEAIVPVDRASGSQVGFIFQAWIFIDDLLPHTFGFPIFGKD